MKIKIFPLFFLFLLCIGCSDHYKEKAILLNKEIAKTPVLSARFDSLMQDINELPLHLKIESVIQISNREERPDGVLKQEKLLNEALLVASKKKRKEILFRLVTIYSQKDRFQFLKSSGKGIEFINELENKYSLTQEEKWNLYKLKARFLNKQGKQEECLPIWFKLLKEHRVANHSQLIVEDLYAIANHFEKLGDKENAITLYKEAYQLSIDNDYSTFAKKIVLSLTLLLVNDKQYREAIKYCKENNLFNNTLISCYLGLNRPDSARLIIAKKLEERGQDGIILNCQMTETYIMEENEDSASVFMGKALDTFRNNVTLQSNKHQNILPPAYFLQTCSKYAELLQKNNKINQAEDTYKLIEPLMRTNMLSLNWREKQIKAITSYSNFCGATHQYKKAVELLAHRDSLQLVYNVMKEEQDKTNLVHRFEVEELTHRLDMQDLELKYSETLNYILICVGFAAFVLLTMIFLLLRNRKKQVLKLYQQNEELEKVRETVAPQETPSPSKALYIKTEKKVQTERLFLRNDLSIEALSDILNSNRTYLSNSINECTGKSYSVWINDFRIKYAIRLMHDNTTINTRNLATQCGFSSNDTFYKNFKQRCGVTPSQYLNQIILEQEQSPISTDPKA